MNKDIFRNCFKIGVCLMIFELPLSAMDQRNEGLSNGLEPISEQHPHLQDQYSRFLNQISDVETVTFLNREKIDSFPILMATVNSLKQTPLDYTQIEAWYGVRIALRHHGDEYKIAETIYDVFQQSNNISKKQSKTYQDAAKQQNLQRNYTGALQLMQKAIEHFPTLGTNYLWLGNHPYYPREERVRSLLIALDLGERLNNKILQAEAWLGLGDARYEDATYQIDRIKCYLYAAHILGDESGRNAITVRAWLGLGNARYEDKNNNRIDLYYRAYEASVRYNHEKLIIRACIALGNSLSIDKVAEKIRWFSEAVALAQKSGDPYHLAQAYAGLGDIHYPHKNHQREWYYHEALRILGDKGDWKLKARIYTALGNLYSAEKNNASALQYYELVLKIIPSKDSRDEEQDIRDKAIEGIRRCQDYMMNARMTRLRSS